MDNVDHYLDEFAYRVVDGVTEAFGVTVHFARVTYLSADCTDIIVVHHIDAFDRRFDAVCSVVDAAAEIVNSIVIIPIWNLNANACYNLLLDVDGGVAAAATVAVVVVAMIAFDDAVAGGDDGGGDVDRHRR